MSLSIRDILILDFFNGKPVHARVPEFQQDIYGADANTRIHDLIDEGWIRHSRPQETLNMLPDKALAGLLTRKGLPAEGTHSELVRLVSQEIPEAEYAHAVPKVFVATADGKLEMAHHMAYILNVRGNYGFSEGEIGEAQRVLSSKGGSCTAQDILSRVFQDKSTIYVMAGEWTKLRNLYFTRANFCLRFRKNEQALSYLFLVFFLDMSGMENRNSLVRYEKLFPTQKGIIILMRELADELSLDSRALKSTFLTSIARMAPRLPFAYFSPQVMGDILLDRLRGIEFDRTRYMPMRNLPDPTAGAYHYAAEPETPARTAASASESFLIQRRVTPPVPPVLRMPSFTAPTPFIPSDAKKKPAPAKKETKQEPPQKEEKPKGMFGKLRGLFSDNSDKK